MTTRYFNFDILLSFQNKPCGLWFQVGVQRTSEGMESKLSASYVELGEIGVGKEIMHFHSTTPTKNTFIYSGAYGTVLRARDRENPNSIVALKRLAVSLTENGIPNNAIREIGILKQLCLFNHPNIVK